MLRWLSTIIIIGLVARIVSSQRPNECLCENEVMSPCVNRVCEYRYCSEIGGPIECIKISQKQCKRGCICKDNYLRADNGTCIPADQCPNSLRCPKPNEYYDLCPPECPSRTCDSIYCSQACPAPLEVGDQRCPPPACRCNPGFYRNSNGYCVVWNLCTTCPENERATSCIQAKCERRDCYDLNRPVACVRIDPAFCTFGCLCQEGLLRADNGTCIPVNQCPEAQCGDNEVFDECPPGCPGEQCGVDASVVLCLAIKQKPGDPSCQPACRCRAGYLRNNNGKCIPQNQCPPTCGVNEVYDTCLSSCPSRRCDALDTYGKRPCIAQTTNCTAGCRCADNFYLNNENVCVPRSECPQVCGPNEVYDTCYKQCPPQSCGVNIRAVLCPLNQTCLAGCRCVGNLVRNRNGICVPRNQCEKASSPSPPPYVTPKRPTPAFF